MNSVKQKLREGKAVLGTFNFFDDPSVAEILGLAGLDFLIIDMEHSPRGFDQVENMVRAAELVGLMALVRVPSGTETEISRALETGAQGIVLRMLEGPDQVREARAAALYPPNGNRGTCSASRAARYTALRPRFGEYIREANDDVLLVGLIESPSGVDNAAAIAAAGLDVVVVGRGDLSAALGVPGENQNPAVRAMCDRVAEVARLSERTIFGSTASSQAEMEDLTRLGCRMFIYRDDTSVLFEAFAKTTEAFRSSLSSQPVAKVQIDSNRN
jgi:4-hydroxy-2-oxoheptanedioate aldolase